MKMFLENDITEVWKCSCIRNVEILLEDEVKEVGKIFLKKCKKPIE